MALKASAVLVFKRYVPEAATHVNGTIPGAPGTVTLFFECADPGAGEPEEYSIVVTEAEVTAITTMASAGALALGKLKRKYRSENIASKLDSLIGQSVTLP